MSTFFAAAGSFHVKSAGTYFVLVLVMVRVLPFLLTVTLIRSVTLSESTLGVRSYNDHRYSLTQLSTMRHSSEGSTGRTALLGYSVSEYDVPRDATCMRVSGGPGSPFGRSATETAESGAAGSARLRSNVATPGVTATASASGRSKDFAAKPKD